MTIDLKSEMTKLFHECKENNDYKKIIAKAVNLGMVYQEQKIKEGIDIVFSALHMK